MADILVTEDIRGEAIEALRAGADVEFDPHLWQDPDALQRQIRSARALIVRNQTRVSAELLGSAPELLIVARAGAGCDNIDVAAASDLGIVVAYTPAANSVSVAELTLGLMLALARRVCTADQSVRRGEWARQRFLGTQLSGKTLGIVGFGRIGRLLAARARALEMQILVHDPLVRPEDDSVRQCQAQWQTLEQLLLESDVVSCHVPLTESTRGLFGYAQFCQMKATALFINTSRGAVVDEPGLVQALREGQIAGAALDVRQQEPPGKSPLDAMEQVILLPHIGAFTCEAQDQVVQAVCRDVSAVLAGRPAAEFANFGLPRKR